MVNLHGPRTRAHLGGLCQSLPESVRPEMPVVLAP
jgi:hypothetical protein